MAWVREVRGQRRAHLARVRDNLALRGAPLELDDGDGAIVDELALFAVGGAVWLVRTEYSSARRETLSVLPLSKDGTPSPATHLVRESEAHELMAPVVTSSAAGPFLFWLEHERGSPHGQLVGVPLDAHGAPAAEPRRLALPAGRPRSLRAECPRDRCQGVLTLGTDTSEHLLGFVWGEAPALEALVFREPGPTEAGQPLSLSGDTLWYAIRHGERGRLRRAQLAW